MTTVTGCSLSKAREMDIDKELWKEMEELARNNPAEATPKVWGDREVFILTTYYPIATNAAVRKMLLKVSPDVSWHTERIRAKARRMGLVKEQLDGN